MVFNRRTHRQISGFFAKHRVRMLHQRVLIAVHASAWREKYLSGGANEKLLQSLRLDLNRAAWDAVKHEAISVRRLHNMAHSRSGHILEWEDVFIAYYGEHWRALRDSCTNQQA